MQQSNEKTKLKTIQYNVLKNPSEQELESFESKINNRFIIKIGEPWNIPEFVIKGMTRPIINSEGEILDNLYLEMYDPITPSTTQSIIKGTRVLKNNENIKTKITLELLGPVGDIVEKWEFTGQFINFDFGTLDWESSKPTIIAAEFKVTKYVHEF